MSYDALLYTNYQIDVSIIKFNFKARIERHNKKIIRMIIIVQIIIIIAVVAVVVITKEYKNNK